MWILIWLITGTHPALDPTAVAFPTQSKCEVERKMIETQIKAVGPSMKSELWCVEATQTEQTLPQTWIQTAPFQGALTTH